MLSSLPPIIPRDAHTLWSPSSLPSPPDHPTTSTSQTQQRRTAPPRNTFLAALDAEEDALRARKSNVRRFGATWLRPPGVPKTYQAMVDEAAERAEQEAIARREQAMAEQAAAAEEEARRLRGMDGEGESEVEGMERDLDEGVPEGEEMVGSGEEDEDGERDLDEDVPEAGSYEHTDTEVEESSTEDEGEMAEERVDAAESGRGMRVVQSDTLAMPPPPPVWGTGVVVGGDGSAEEGDSSMLVSSPSVPRGARRQAAIAGRANRLRENQRTS